MENKQNIKMTLTPLPDGTNRMTDLKIGDPNKRYWEYNERGHIVWESHPEGVTVPDGISVIGQLRCPILGEIILPHGVREIDDLAFGAEFYTGDTYEWYALRTIHLSGGLRRIGYRAFYNCHRLDGVRLPKGLEKIAEGAFGLCLSLSRITIPESVELLGYAAFSKCYSLKEVIFRDGLKQTGAAVFAEDRSLEKVILPKTLERLGCECFSGCSALPEIDLPESLKEIGENAFLGCSALTSFHFKRDLENIEELHRRTPFKDCTALTEFYLDNAVTRADWIPSAPALKSINVDRDHPHFKSVDGVLYSKDKKTLLGAPAIEQVHRGACLQAETV